MSPKLVAVENCTVSNVPAPSYSLDTLTKTPHPSRKVKSSGSPTLQIITAVFSSKTGPVDTVILDASTLTTKLKVSGISVLRVGDTKTGSQGNTITITDAGQTKLLSD